jgi:type II secretory pathway pseudopilin PulG
MMLRTKKQYRPWPTPGGRRRIAAYTLAEVLAAMAFMAVVIPVVCEALKVATLAGEVAQRKTLAMRVAQKVLDEAELVNQWNSSSQRGTQTVGQLKFQWAMRNDPWDQLVNAVNVSTPAGINQLGVNSTTMHLITVDVTYQAQGRDYAVHLSTLANVAQMLQTGQQVITIPQQ